MGEDGTREMIVGPDVGRRTRARAGAPPRTSPGPEQDAPTDRAAPPAASGPAGAPPPSGRPPRRLRALARRRWRWLAAAAVAAAAVWLVVRPTPIDIDAGLVVRAPLEVTVEAQGRTRVADRFRIAAPVAGRLERIALREGAVVAAGAAVARITPLPLDAQTEAAARARLSAAEAAFDGAAAQAARAGDARAQLERSVTRARSLHAAGAISDAALERAELDLAAGGREHDAALARQRQAVSEIDAARAALLSLAPGAVGAATVRAPVGGRVLRIHESSERVVQAGTPLVELGDVAALEIVVDVLSTDAVRIRPGAAMRIVAWGGDTELDGRVRTVEPSAFTRLSALGVEEQRVNIVGAAVAPPAGLGDGYRVEVRIVTWYEDDVLQVPTSALFRADDGWAAFVVEDGRARLRTVVVGRRGAATAQVLRGLAADDVVILFPSDAVHDGARVAP